VISHGKKRKKKKRTHKIQGVWKYAINWKCEESGGLQADRQEFGREEPEVAGAAEAEEDRHGQGHGQAAARLKNYLFYSTSYDPFGPGQGKKDKAYSINK
jgi:hypothetical protein